MTIRMRGLPAVLRENRNFRLMFLADGASSLGTAVSVLAFPLLVLALGGSAVQAGSIATVSIGTRMALRLPAGHLVDRWSPRAVMIGTDLVRFLALGSIPAMALLASAPSFGHLIAVAAVDGICGALFGPAVDVLTRDITAADEVSEALGLAQAVQASAMLAGPAIGGALFTVAPMLPFLLDAATYAASALWLWRMRVRRGGGAATEPERGGLTAGFRWLVRSGPLFTVLLYGAVINMVSVAIDVMVVVDLQARGEPAAAVGLILSCSGAGAVIGAVLAPVVTRRVGVPAILLGIGCAWVAVLVVFATVFSPWLVGALLVVLMLLSPSAGVIVGTALLTATPRPLLGRVSAATSILLTGMSALAPIGAGVLVQWFGPARGWWTLAALTAAVTAVCWRPLQASRLLGGATSEREPEVLDVLAHELRPDDER